MDDGRMKCKLCRQLFAQGTSISRIKFHLSGVKGRGVKICEDVPKEVQDAALAAIDGPPEKKLKTVAGSSSNEVPNAQEQNNEGTHVEMAQHGEAVFTGEHAWANDFIGGGIELVHNTSERRPVSEQLCSPTVNNDVIMNEVIGGIEPMHNAPETRPITEQTSQERERGICDFSSSSTVDNVIGNNIENPATGFMQPGAGASSSGGLKYYTSETRGDLLPTSSTKLVGRAFEENRNMIWSWLMDDEVLTIGVYGMEGVGKTTMLQYIHNELLKRLDISRHVY
jgi:disease resistance protein RPS2